MRQYFYLVAYTYDECTVPRKVFFQEHDAIQWGRREATKMLLNTGDTNYEFKLYKQEITRTGELQLVKDRTLKPYPTKELVDRKLIIPKLPKDNAFGADYDIDLHR